MMISLALLLFPLFHATSQEEIVQIVNNVKGGLWKAKVYNKTEFDVEAAMMHMDSTILSEEPVFSSPLQSTPEVFDARERWPEFQVPIQMQAACNGCWAFATTASMTYRLGVAGCYKGLISPQDLLSCDKTNKACQGGNPLRAMLFAANNGIASDDCVPFVSEFGRVPLCPSKCKNGSAIERYKYKTPFQVGVSDVQTLLMESGPLYARFNVYADFLNYEDGIYEHVTGRQLGSHAVLLLGWGVEKGVDYWLLQNSYSEEWGEKGYFRMRRGSNQCGMENAFYGGIVDCNAL
ncbi:putative Gut-specific cysteine proteinase [Blattamonas nauphoetae]|uniref:Gut-specific cysteine proteinase n=1 Tax=Blattamonas nauphoetae TaxID=2049346 RepID=A0ABQ9WUT9_9EUKA|nr:putative Gut-specific cysteine proteinase [Blattamonas nauphoetae]